MSVLIKTKYSCTDTVHFVHNGRVMTGEVVDMSIWVSKVVVQITYRICVGLRDYWRRQGEVFASVDDLHKHIEETNNERCNEQRTSAGSITAKR